MPTPGSVSAALDPTAPLPYKNGREWHQHVVLTLTDNYVADGVTVDLSGLDTPGSSMPFRVDFYPAAGDSYHYVRGTTRADGKLVAYTGSSQHTDDAAWAEATLKATVRYKASGI